MISFEIDRAAQMLRALVNRIEPVPDGEEPAIVLRSDIAAILTFAAGKKSPLLEQNAVIEDLMGQTPVSGAEKRKKPRGGGSLGSQGSLVSLVSFVVFCAALCAVGCLRVA